jgi:hypothetical protein
VTPPGWALSTPPDRFRPRGVVGGRITCSYPAAGATDGVEVRPVAFRSTRSCSPRLEKTCRQRTPSASRSARAAGLAARGVNARSIHLRRLNHVLYVSQPEASQSSVDRL